MQFDDDLKELLVRAVRFSGQIDPRAPTVLDEIEAERLRQIYVEGWTSEHDNQHKWGELSRAAAAYAWNTTQDTFDRGDGAPTIWPWDPAWWKPKDRRRDLIRAAALLVAEIERLDRARTAAPATTTPKPSHD